MHVFIVDFMSLDIYGEEGKSYLLECKPMFDWKLFVCVHLYVDDQQMYDHPAENYNTCVKKLSDKNFIVFGVKKNPWEAIRDVTLSM